MNLTHRPTKIFVTGVSGHGKSVYATRYILGSRHRWKFVLDHEGEFSQRTQARACHTPAHLLAAVETGWVVFDPGRMFPGATPDAFRFFADWTFNVAQRLPGSKLFACDELQKLTDARRCDWELACLLETGRRYALDTLMVSQQPNLVHNRVRSQVTEVVAFGQNDENAISYLREMGFDPAEIRSLRPGAYVLLHRPTMTWRRGTVF